MRRVRHNTGSVLFDKGRSTWRFLQWINGKRRSQTLGTKQELPTKAAAWKVASTLMPKKPKLATGITVSSLVEVYRTERMPQRFSTRYSYDQWLTNHILPHWGEGRSLTYNRVPLNCGCILSRCLPRAEFTFGAFCINFGSSLCGAVMCQQSAIR
jgi:hypothetical protein